jgi:hypothetical protein
MDNFQITIGSCNIRFPAESVTPFWVEKLASQLVADFHKFVSDGKSDKEAGQMAYKIYSEKYDKEFAARRIS